MLKQKMSVTMISTVKIFTDNVTGEETSFQTPLHSCVQVAYGLRNVRPPRPSVRLSARIGPVPSRLFSS